MSGLCLGVLALLVWPVVCSQPPKSDRDEWRFPVGHGAREGSNGPG